MGLSDMLGRAARKIGTKRAPALPDSVVTHDSLDTMAFRNYVDESTRFRKVIREESPRVVMHAAPEPIDFGTATVEEMQAYGQAVRDHELAVAQAPHYSAWEELGHDVFSAYHAYDEPSVIDAAVDPGVELHKKLVSRLIADDDFRDVRSATRNDDMTSAVATMAALRSLKDALGDELADQARQAEEYRENVRSAKDQTGALEDLRDQAATEHRQGGVSQDTRDLIKAAVAARRAAQDAAAASVPAPLGADAAEAVSAAATAGKDAAERLGDMPQMGAGLGAGEVAYTSPDEALALAEKWASNPQLKAVSQMFGRLDRDIRFHRSKRVIGGQDEIVDVEFGDNLSRVIPAELALLADDDTELDFLARYAAGELLTFSTVGEEHGGRGPIVCVIDGSSSMGGQRTAWARAVAMSLLHICRREKRDFAAVEFGSPGQSMQWEFPKRQPVSGAKLTEMASHFYNGGTAPLPGMRRAQNIINAAPGFTEADVVLIGDGEASFTDADAAVRAALIAKGVRTFGIGVGGSFAYLNNYCEHVVSVSDMELSDPSSATASLATHMT